MYGVDTTQVYGTGNCKWSTVLHTVYHPRMFLGWCVLLYPGFLRYLDRGSAYCIPSRDVHVLRMVCLTREDHTLPQTYIEWQVLSGMYIALTRKPELYGHTSLSLATSFTLTLRSTCACMVCTLVLVFHHPSLTLYNVCSHRVPLIV